MLFRRPKTPTTPNKPLNIYIGSDEINHDLNVFEQAKLKTLKCLVGASNIWQRNFNVFGYVLVSVRTYFMRLIVELLVFPCSNKNCTKNVPMYIFEQFIYQFVISLNHLISLFIFVLQKNIIISILCVVLLVTTVVCIS